MGYHTESDIPNYWTYAKDFVLQDHMFEPNASWSLPAHLFLVSEWSAFCTQKDDPSSCVNALQRDRRRGRQRPRLLRGVPGAENTGEEGQPIYAWTDLTYLLHKSHVSWGYYVVRGPSPTARTRPPRPAAPGPERQHPGDLEPPALFDTVKADHQLGNIRDVDTFFAAAKSGTLPAVSWVVPSGEVSEHPPAPVATARAT